MILYWILDGMYPCEEKDLKKQDLCKIHSNYD